MIPELLAALTLTTTPPPAEPPAAVAPPITVIAPRKATVRDFISRVGQTGGDGQLARWSAPICPEIVGADGYAGYFKQRIDDIAREVGAPVGAAGCDPNLQVIFTPDPQRLLHRLEAERSHLFRGEHAANAADLSRPRPVYVAQSVGVATRSGGDTQFYCTSAAICLPTSQGDLPTASRLTRNFSDAIGLTFVVVDTRAARGVTFGALSGYIAEVVLAQFDPDVRIAGMPSILNLFAERDAGGRGPTELTAWDRAYLTGLYATASSATAAAQRSEIYQRLRRGAGIADDPASGEPAAKDKGAGPATAP